MTDQTVVVDVGGLDTIRRFSRTHLDGASVANEQREFPIPEEYMDKLEKLLGDGNASVTVGADMKFSDFGNGYSSSVFVKLTCGQSMDTILATREAGRELAEQFARDGFDAMKVAYDIATGNETAVERVPDKVTKAPAKATGKNTKKKFTIQR